MATSTGILTFPDMTEIFSIATPSAQAVRADNTITNTF